jgi:hypothetical protein
MRSLRFGAAQAIDPICGKVHFSLCQSTEQRGRDESEIETRCRTCNTPGLHFRRFDPGRTHHWLRLEDAAADRIMIGFESHSDFRPPNFPEMFMYGLDKIDMAAVQEPPSFLVGCDEQNHWVAMEVHGLCGGIFTDQAAALKFAYEETGWRKHAVRLVPRISVFPSS